MLGRFAYIWQYQVDPARRAEFLEAYGPDGDWARLFSRDANYLGTTLLQDVADKNRFATIDRWKSKVARDAFRRRFTAEFDELDRRCEAFTRSEFNLGDFIEIGGTPEPPA